MIAEDWARLISALEREVSQRPSEPRPRKGTDNPWAEMRARLQTIARAMALSADVEDAVQGVLLRLQRPDTLRRLKASRSPKGYLTVMVRNAAVDLVRRREPGLREGRLWVESGTPEPDEELQGLEGSAAVAGLLRELTDSDRELLRLRFWEDVSMAEIARRLQLPYSTVAVRMFRLLRRLRGRLETDEPPPAG